MTITGHIIDIFRQTSYPGTIEVAAGKIIGIQPTDEPVTPQYLLPGFIDAHVHIESSLLVPTEFARLAVVHGTVATVSDPHEIGNVLGVAGVEFMIENGRRSPFKFYFGAPSCVPATTFETAGARISPSDVDYLLAKPEVKYLAEMMNWPGVLHNDPEVFEKIALARQYGKPVDGHAPGLMGEDAARYIAAGISTDHECFTRAEALGKLERGMKIIIREGSAAKNFAALADLIPDHHAAMLFCSDDKHPDSLVAGHINSLVKRALAMGIDLFQVLRVACVNPVLHYGLDVGLLRVGDPADFIAIDNLQDFNVLQTYIAGELVAENGVSRLPSLNSTHPNNFVATTVAPEQFAVPHTTAKIPVIEVIDGELITHRLDVPPLVSEGWNVSDTERDILKITVVNRYQAAPPAVAFIKNFGLREGAIASSVGHDSHNIIAVGVDDASLAAAVNLIMANCGGLAAVSKGENQVIPLPIAGLMTDGDGYAIAAAYIAIDQLVKQMGSRLLSPFMSLSFMALLVIPAIKLSDLGLFDGHKFEFIE
ncbi:MAG: adenine deaminase [Bacteroidetes bacterium]|nr:MAG: adenine deaminase [Bacteroidota bacterium]